MAQHAPGEVPNPFIVIDDHHAGLELCHSDWLSAMSGKTAVRFAGVLQSVPHPIIRLQISTKRPDPAGTHSATAG
jgi:hypothetical protein